MHAPYELTRVTKERWHYRWNAAFPTISVTVIMAPIKVRSEKAQRKMTNFAIGECTWLGNSLSTFSVQERLHSCWFNEPRCAHFHFQSLLFRESTPGIFGVSAFVCDIRCNWNRGIMEIYNPKYGKLWFGKNFRKWNYKFVGDWGGLCLRKVVIGFHFWLQSLKNWNCW